MKIVVLGSGTSHGVPMVGCDCKVCLSKDPRDKRTRASVYIEGAGGESALIDAGPEFRLQAVAAGIRRLDGIFLTHPHADHLHGLDDVRPLSRNNPLPVYGNSRTIAEMKARFSYVWSETQRGGGKPKLVPLEADAPVTLGNLVFTPVPVKHGILDILGWEVVENGSEEKAGKSFLYLTDTSAIPAATFARLGKKPRVVVVGGLRTRPHETHFTFEEAMNAALSLGAEEAYLTHICHDYSHVEIEEICRNFRRDHGTNETKIHPARDGLELFL